MPAGWLVGCSVGGDTGESGPATADHSCTHILSILAFFVGVGLGVVVEGVVGAAGFGVGHPVEP